MADEQKPIEQEAVNPAGTANSELTEKELATVAGGHDDESPKETVSFHFTKVEVG